MSNYIELEDFSSAIEAAIKDSRCKSIGDKSFVNLVADKAKSSLGNPEKSILRVLCDDSGVQTLVAKKGKVSHVDFEVKNILYRIKTSNGYDEELVFGVLLQLLKGAGCSKQIIENIQKNRKEEAELKERREQEEKALREQREKERKKKEREEIARIKQREKERERKRQEEIAQREKERERREQEKVALKETRKQKIKKDFLSIYNLAMYAMFILLVVECIIFLISLIIIIIGWISGSGHAPVWTCLLWESLAIGILSIIGMFIFG